MGRRDWNGDQTLSKRGFLGKQPWHRLFIWHSNVLEVSIWNICVGIKRRQIHSWMRMSSCARHEMICASFREHAELIYQCTHSIQTSNSDQRFNSCCFFFNLPPHHPQEREHIDSPLISFPVTVCGWIPQSWSQMDLSPVDCLTLGIEGWAKERMKNDESRERIGDPLPSSQFRQKPKTAHMVKR